MGLSYMTSTEVWAFWTPLPSLSAKSVLFVCKFRAFVDSPFPLLCGRHIWKPGDSKFEIISRLMAHPSFRTVNAFGRRSLLGHRRRVSGAVPAIPPTPAGPLLRSAETPSHA